MSFRAAAAIAFLVFAANAAVSPLYRIYQAQFGFSATTLTLLFAVYIAVLLLTLLFLGSVSDYAGRRPVMLAGLIVGAAACGLFLSAHALELLFAARALQGVAAGLLAGTASAVLHDLRPDGRATPVVSSAAPTGGQARARRAHTADRPQAGKTHELTRYSAMEPSWRDFSGASERPNDSAAAGPQESCEKPSRPAMRPPIGPQCVLSPLAFPWSTDSSHLAATVALSLAVHVNRGRAGGRVHVFAEPT
jgi:MFS transporter